MGALAAVEWVVSRLGVSGVRVAGSESCGEGVEGKGWGGLWKCAVEGWVVRSRWGEG